MRTTTLTITIEARANASESRIREALLADLRDLWAHGHARATEDNKPVRVRFSVAECAHDWHEQPGEPPVDVCVSCGEVRR